MTDISKLGEFGLIRHLTDNIKIKNESTIKGVGDDCAVLHYPDSEVLHIYVCKVEVNALHKHVGSNQHLRVGVV